MNHQTIIDLAIAEGLTFIPEANCPLARIVRKAVAMEREECAKAAKAISDKYAFGYYGQEVDTADEIEAAIRARSTA